MGAGRCRELYAMKVKDVRDLTTKFLVTIPTRKSQNEFTIGGRFYNIVKKYIDLRPSKVHLDCFFLNYQKGKCTVQRIGINKFSAMRKQVALFLNKPDPDIYSGYSFSNSAVMQVLFDEEDSLEVPSTVQNISEEDVVMQEINEAVVSPTQGTQIIPKTEDFSQHGDTSTSTFFNPENTQIKSEKEDVDEMPLTISAQSSHIKLEEEDFPEYCEETNAEFKDLEMKLEEDDFCEIDEASTSTSLPKKSAKKYVEVYNMFLEWKRKKGVTSFSENVLLSYFEELANKYSPSSMWTHYSMLRATIDQHHKIKINNYTKLKAFLKRKSVGYQAKKTNTFNARDIDSFLKLATDFKYLGTKVNLLNV